MNSYDDQKRFLLKAARRLQAIEKSKDSLLDFMQLMMPHPEDQDDVTKSLYEATAPARLLAELMQQIEARKLKRVAVSIGPQFGKSTVISRMFPAWAAGRNPRANMILGSYNSDLATGFGADVRGIIQSNAFKQVFPQYELDKGGGAKDALKSTENGRLHFVGVGGTGTGKSADHFIIDDPIKNDEEAQSEVYRERLWNWYSRVVFSRVKTNTTITVVQTRWSEDDLIGRLCDPNHPERHKKYAGIAENWTYINLPAVVTDQKLADVLHIPLEAQTNKLIVSMFGTKPMASLWEKEKSLLTLAEAKQVSKRDFGALYMGQPTPEDGEYFTQDMLVEYHKESELPRRLRVYGASDHALSEDQRADYNVIGCVGIDERDDIWVLPDLIMERMETYETVETMLDLFKRRRPLLWWMEQDTIGKSFGPFLYKRMHEEKVYTSIDAVSVSKEKKVRARAIQGRMRMRKVHFPAFAPWWTEAKGQLLKFPYGTHDDFVDFMAHIGAGLLKEFPAAKADDEKPENVVTVGSLAWILAESRRRAQQEQRKVANAGW